MTAPTPPPAGQHFPDGGGRVHAGSREGCWLCDPPAGGVGSGEPKVDLEAPVIIDLMRADPQAAVKLIPSDPSKGEAGQAAYAVLGYIDQLVSHVEELRKGLRFIVGALSDTDGRFLPDESFSGLVGEVFRAMTDAGLNPNDFVKPGVDHA